MVNTHSKNEVVFPIGESKDGSPIELVLSKSNPTMLISGSTGCGKSNLLEVMIKNNHLTDPKDIHIFNGKGVGFEHMKFLPNMVDETPLAVENVFKAIHTMINHRVEWLQVEGCSDFTQVEAMEPKVYILDDVVTAENPEYIKEQMEVITKTCRAVGVFIVWATQVHCYPVNLDMFTSRVIMKMSDDKMRELTAWEPEVPLAFGEAYIPTQEGLAFVKIQYSGDIVID